MHPRRNEREVSNSPHPILSTQDRDVPPIHNRDPQGHVEGEQGRECRADFQQSAPLQLRKACTIPSRTGTQRIRNAHGDFSAKLSPRKKTAGTPAHHATYETTLAGCRRAKQVGTLVSIAALRQQISKSQTNGNYLTGPANQE